MPQRQRRERHEQQQRASRRSRWLGTPWLWLGIGAAMLALAGTGIFFLQGEDSTAPEDDALTRQVRLTALEEAVYNEPARSIWLDVSYEPLRERAPDIRCSARDSAGTVLQSRPTFAILREGVARKQFTVPEPVPGNYQIHCASGSSSITGNLRISGASTVTPVGPVAP